MASAPRVVARRRTQAARSKEDYDDTRCEECGSGDFGSELLLCDHCNLGFHLFCLRPILASVPMGSWFCPSCSSNRNRNTISRFPLVQTKIIDFFCIQRSSENVCQVKKRRRTRSLATSKKKRPARRLEQMASLATALTATGAAFSNDLTYIHGMAPKSANSPAYEKGGMQVLSREDTAALNLCKNMMRKGECPPLMLVFDPVEGEGKKKQSLKCVRFDVDGEARVVLVANRDISKGERLYYDYNAYEHEYPTEHFV
ncbi:hypothetical protein L1987_35542 [Smallanthus sonchifolius]|uniref:Uncharacterized protein n=1 Tax=Smallanthus sonchifolius TaxID=185202 RepID=A0ACB9HYD0_9ASTR|nr:hypothetical protein L1987_35542 [Smallanthus sonchifolius]